jgi:putative heme iron utilization protein
MTHEPRLTTELRGLLQSHRIASLGTLNPDGAPFVSMVPFAIASNGQIAIHISGLAAHTRNLQASPQVSLLVMQSEVPGEPVHALHRGTLQGTASLLQRDTEEWMRARSAYLARFPEAEPMTQLGDFCFVAIEISAATQVAGFGAARTLDAEAVQQALLPPA